MSVASLKRKSGKKSSIERVRTMSDRKIIGEIGKLIRSDFGSKDQLQWGRDFVHEALGPAAAKLSQGEIDKLAEAVVAKMKGTAAGGRERIKNYRKVLLERYG